MNPTRTSHPYFLAAMVAVLIAYGASPAHAAGSCSTTSGTTTCAFGPTGSEDHFEVPDGVSSIHVVATGAPGAVGSDGGPAGRGATVSGDLKVTSGDTLFVEVGGAPTGSGTTNCFPTVDCIGGFNGGGASRFGGGGGGASDVRTVSSDQNGSLGSRLIVAAGGGGSGEDADCMGPTDPLGGSGGDAGTDGGDGPKCGNLAGGGGGKSGTQNAGGDGGSPLGQSGSLGLGGTGGAFSGGAGGGGYYGGGGGGRTVLCPADKPCDGDAPAGGGGGGSNLVPDGGSATLDDSGDPSIAISYQAGPGEEPPTEPETKQACKKGGYREFGFRNQGQCIKAVNHAS